jgi:subtilisin family serine protease
MTESQEQPESGNYWPGLILTLLVTFWLLTASRGIYLTSWFVDQISIAEGGGWSAWIWLLIGIGHILLIAAAPAAPAFLIKRPRYKAVFLAMLWSAVYAVFLLPVRMVPTNGQQAAAVVQIVFSALFCGAFLLYRRRRALDWVRPDSPFLPALLVPPLLILGWLAWGALGSFLDSLLNLLAGLALGASLGLILGHVLFPVLQRTGSTLSNILLGGLVINGMLGVMGSAYGFNGAQLFLMFALPALGWLVMSVAIFGRQMGSTEADLVENESPPLSLKPGWLSAGLFTGLVTSAVLMFVDPDELLLVLNLGSGEILGWSFWANVVLIISSWALSLVMLGLNSLLPNWRRRSVLIPVIVVLWGIGVLVYLLGGQPGFFGERYFVILDSQADLSGAAAIPEPVDKRAFVYDTLTAHADSTQSGLRGTFDLLRIPYTPYYLVNAIEVNANPLLRLVLNVHPDVDRVLDSPVLRPLPAQPDTARGFAVAGDFPQWNLTSIGADRVWNELGVTGEGIVIGQSDSGVQGDHPELESSYRGLNGSDDYNWFDPWNHTTVPTDIGGHGTHTLGSALGRRVGVAPGASWFGCVNLARNLANPALYLDCLQFMLAPFPQNGSPHTQGDPALGANVINNSWGCPAAFEGCDPNSLQPAVAALRAAGIFVVASAGNDGSACETIQDPIAIYDESFSVGAFGPSGELMDFSSRGPVSADGSGRTKPDIIAPGANVFSSYPNGTYERNQGTSMAGPHIVGVVALIWSANPDLIGQVDLTEQILIETAQPYNFARFGTPSCSEGTDYPNNAVGFGVVDAFAAVQRALELAGD